MIPLFRLYGICIVQYPCDRLGIRYPGHKKGCFLGCVLQIDARTGIYQLCCDRR